MVEDLEDEAAEVVAVELGELVPPVLQRRQVLDRRVHQRLDAGVFVRAAQQRDQGPAVAVQRDSSQRLGDNKKSAEW